jgi:CBS domain-containing membrane protein
MPADLVATARRMRSSCAWLVATRSGCARATISGGCGAARALQRQRFMLVAKVMSSPVVSLLADQSVPLARDVMGFAHVRHLPVVDVAGRLVGLVTHRDLVRWADITAELHREGRADLRVEQIMTRDVWSVGPDDDAAAVGRIMLDRKYGCAPVVDARGALVGIVTASDFLRLAIEAIESRDARGANGHGAASLSSAIAAAKSGGEIARVVQRGR